MMSLPSDAHAYVQCLKLNETKCIDFERRFPATEALMSPYFKTCTVAMDKFEPASILRRLNRRNIRLILCRWFRNIRARVYYSEIACIILAFTPERVESKEDHSNSEHECDEQTLRAEILT